MKPDNGIHKTAFVQNAPDGPRVVTAAGNGNSPMRCRDRQRMTQIILRVDEGGPRQMQSHDLHQHLVGIGSAIKGTGAGPVIGGSLRLQQFCTACLAPRKGFAYGRFLIIWEAACHRAGRHEDGWQMAE